MAIEIVDLPIENGGSFHSKLLVYQRVSWGSHNSNFTGGFMVDIPNYISWGLQTNVHITGGGTTLFKQQTAVWVFA